MGLRQLGCSSDRFPESGVPTQCWGVCALALAIDRSALHIMTCISESWVNRSTDPLSAILCDFKMSCQLMAFLS